MGRLTEDMTRLCGEIGALRDTRKAFTNDLVRRVADMKAGFRSDHAEMAAELRRTLDDNEAKRMPEAHDAHEQRIAEIEERKRDVKETLAGFREAHAGMARRTRGYRMAFKSELKANVAEMRGSFRKDWAKLFAFVAGLKQTVAGLRQELAEDISGARRAWSGPSPVERRIRPKAEPQREEAELRAKEEKRPRHPEAKPAVIVPDDLTTIQGIGPGMEERLKEAGIYSFAVLARSTPDELRQALGRLARLADVDRWIEEARKLG